MSNPLTGETEITIDGADYILSPTFKAAMALEAATGKSPVQLFEDLRVLKQSSIAAVIFHTIIGKKPSFDAIGEAVTARQKAGDNSLFDAALTVITGYFPKAEDTPKGNANAPSKKATG